MIGGFEEPTEGRIELQGEDVTWLPAYKRNVNTVFQNYALFPHLTIYENVAFGLRRKKVADAEVKKRVTEMLELVELPGYETPQAAARSPAARRSASRSRARSSTSPAVLLLDEPLGALDLKLRKQMQVELKRIQQEVGITFIYVTHDQEEAMTMSDRIAVMNQGRYEQLGDPEALYERPKTRFVAGFLGVSNLLPATPDGTDGGYAAFRSPTAPPVRVPGCAGRGPRRVALGVRPEKIRLVEPAKDIAGRPQPAARRDRARLLPGRQHAVHRRARRRPRVTVFEQNVERATKAELWDGRRAGRPAPGRPTTASSSRMPAGTPRPTELTRPTTSTAGRLTATGGNR